MLRTTLRATAFVCAVWLVLVTGGLWSSRRALAFETAGLAARRLQMTEEAARIHHDRAEAAKADRVSLEEPARVSGAVVAEVEAAARLSGVDLVSLRITPAELAAANQTAPAPGAGQAPQGGSAAPGGSAPPGGSGGPADQGAAPDPGWRRASVECTAVGTYGALRDFMERLADVDRVLDINSLQVGRSPAGARTRALQVQAKLAATLYGLGSSR